MTRAPSKLSALHDVYAYRRADNLVGTAAGDVR